MELYLKYKNHFKYVFKDNFYGPDSLNWMTTDFDSCIDETEQMQISFNKSYLVPFHEDYITFIGDKISSDIFFSHKLNYNWLIIPGSAKYMENITNIMLLFYMDEKSIQCKGIICSHFVYSMHRSFTENIFYVMIFRLGTMKSFSTVKKILSEHAEKYKILISNNYLPSELNIEISRYWIYFILMCMD
jgi:hypothetical protein